MWGAGCRAGWLPTRVGAVWAFCCGWERLLRAAGCPDGAGPIVAGLNTAPPGLERAHIPFAYEADLLNMAGAYDYKRDRHARAWQWLNKQDADVALLQEVVPHPEELGAWGSRIFRGKYKQHGCAVLLKAGGYRAWEPTDQEPWLKRVGGAARDREA